MRRCVEYKYRTVCVCKPLCAQRAEVIKYIRSSELIHFPFPLHSTPSLKILKIIHVSHAQHPKAQRKRLHQIYDMMILIFHQHSQFHIRLVWSANI